jgi:hypothetical protein
MTFGLSLFTPVIVAVAIFRLWPWYAILGAALTSGVGMLLTLTWFQYRRWHRERPLFVKFYGELREVFLGKIAPTEGHLMLCWILVQEYGTKAQRRQLDAICPSGCISKKEAKQRWGI